MISAVTLGRFAVIFVVVILLFFIVIYMGTDVINIKADKYSGYNYVESGNIRTQLLANLFSIFCCAYSGFFVGVCVGAIVGEERLNMFHIVGEGIVAVLLYLFLSIGFRHFKRPMSHVVFIVVYILSIIVCTKESYESIPIRETTTETILTETKKRELLSFNNISIQEISGEVSGYNYRGTGEIYGNISTSNEFSFWYLENNDGIYDTVNVSDANIEFIPDDEKPYIKILSYKTTTKTIDLKTEKKLLDITDSRWNEYHFYMPKKMMQ